LIVNGEKTKISGNGGGGLAPRTAIGQRKDGIILFLVLDGNRTLGQGASYADLLEIMSNYGAYNATCLDGGTSTGMTVKNKFINNPTTKSGLNKSRPIPTAFILKSDEEDNGDYSIVLDKIK
jgi:exopolysaccharide biosynthesis protein